MAVGSIGPCEKLQAFRRSRDCAGRLISRAGRSEGIPKGFMSDI